VQAFLELYESLDTPEFSEITPEEADGCSRRCASSRSPTSNSHPSRTTIDGPRRPRGAELRPGTEGEDRPLLLYFHGGGWVVGSIDTHDGVCRKLADDTGYPVVSVDYGLCRTTLPRGLQDCYAALEWAAAEADELNADPDKIVVGGDSAGGGLAAGLSLLARDRGGPEIAYQLLLYPSVGDATVTEAYEENKEGYFLTEDDMEWFRGHLYESDIDLGTSTRCRCARTTSRNSRRRRSSPPASIRCATSVRTTPTDSPTPASPSSTTTTTT